mgnify:CR=1 FL=1
MLLRLFVSGVLGGIIGFGTNFIALRMLFYPKKKVFGFQGLLARFKNNFAEKIGDHRWSAGSSSAPVRYG